MGGRRPGPRCLGWNGSVDHGLLCATGCSTTASILPGALPPDPRLVSLCRLRQEPFGAGNRPCQDSLCHGYAYVCFIACGCGGFTTTLALRLLARGENGDEHVRRR